MLDRWGRSRQDLINMITELRDRAIGFTSPHENLDTTTPGGRLVGASVLRARGRARAEARRTTGNQACVWALQTQSP